jgi:hypothetical protein
MRSRWLVRIGRVLLIVLIAATVLGFIVMQLWNGLIPGLFNGPVLSFWQAVGLLLLSRILFFGGPGGRFGGGRRDRWRRRFEDRWEKMSPEERERMRERWGDRCGWRDEDAPDVRGTGTAE